MVLCHMPDANVIVQKVLVPLVLVPRTAYFCKASEMFNLAMSQLAPTYTNYDDSHKHMILTK